MRPLSRSSNENGCRDQFRGDSTAPRVNKVLDWARAAQEPLFLNTE